MNRLIEFALTPKVQRITMMISGMALAVATAKVPGLESAQVALYPMASALFFWALRGPGHVCAQ